jgi:hypothetical protein
MHTFLHFEVDGSGVVSFKEFADAIQGNRLAESNVSGVLRIMDGTLSNLGSYLAKVGNSFDILKKTEERRRLMKEEWEANIDSKTNEIIQKLQKTLGRPETQVDDKEKI